MIFTYIKHTLGLCDQSELIIANAAHHAGPFMNIVKKQNEAAKAFNTKK